MSRNIAMQCFKNSRKCSQCDTSVCNSFAYFMLHWQLCSLAPIVSRKNLYVVSQKKRWHWLIQQPLFNSSNIRTFDSWKCLLSVFIALSPFLSWPFRCFSWSFRSVICRWFSVLSSINFFKLSISCSSGTSSSGYLTPGVEKATCTTLFLNLSACYMKIEWLLYFHNWIKPCLCLIYLWEAI